MGKCPLTVVTGIYEHRLAGDKPAPRTCGLRWSRFSATRTRPSAARYCQHGVDTRNWLLAGNGQHAPYPMLSLQPHDQGGSVGRAAHAVHPRRTGRTQRPGRDRTSRAGLRRHTVAGVRANGSARSHHGGRSTPRCSPPSACQGRPRPERRTNRHRTGSGHRRARSRRTPPTTIRGASQWAAPVSGVDCVFYGLIGIATVVAALVGGFYFLFVGLPRLVDARHSESGRLKRVAEAQQRVDEILAATSRRVDETARRGDRSYGDESARGTKGSPSDHAYSVRPSADRVSWPSNSERGHHIEVDIEATGSARTSAATPTTFVPPAWPCARREFRLRL